MPNTCVVKLHHELYPAEVVKKAAADFSELAAIKIKKTKSHYEIALTYGAGVKPDALEGEFLNYCLMLAKAVG